MNQVMDREAGSLAEGVGNRDSTAGNSTAGESTTGPLAQVTLDFPKADGLVAGIVQDARSGEILMLGFLNEQSWKITQETGFVTFWSRTRGKLWMKGETSGNRLRIVSAVTDCDQDALLFRVEVEGDGLVCHEGTVSCFTKELRVAGASS